jgi:LysB family phage lysis regulatory protein
MELIVKSLISALFVGVLVLVIYVQRDSLTAAHVRIEHAEQATRDRDGTIKTLTDAAARNRQAAAKLEAANDNIAATLAERENQLESLLHDNPQVRNWFDTPLPDAVVGLREHAAATGAGAYRQRLPGSDPLPTAGDGAQN